MRYFQNPPPVYLGHVRVGGAHLFPTWKSKAIRPAHEIAKYKDKIVVVVGKIAARAPEHMIRDSNGEKFLAALHNFSVFTYASVN